MTKDRPRNRGGNGPKSGGFRGGDARKSWQRERGADRVRPEREPARDAKPADGDKPWRKERGPERSGERSGAPQKPGGKPWRSDRPDKRRDGKPPEAKQHGDARAGDKPRGQQFDKPRHDKPREDAPRGEKPRGEFRGKAARFGDKRRDGPPRDSRHGDGQHAAKWDRRDAAFEENGEVWIWGVHAAAAALANPARKISKALVSRNGAVRAGLDPDALPAFAELLEPKEIDLRMPQGAVHQGVAVRCAQIDGPDISDAAMRPERPLVILDQVTDPQNVGAVYRSAAAFRLAGVVMQTRNAPLLGGALAKAAAGAIERVDDIRAVNISRAIDALTDAGWRVIGLDGSAEQTLEEAFAGPEPLAIVLGAEGSGIRQGVAKACTGLARIPIGADMESLNVSNAAAIAFYEAQRRHGAAPPPAKAVIFEAGDDEDEVFDGVPDNDPDDDIDDSFAGDADDPETE